MSKFYSEILLVQLLATYLVILGHSYPFVTEVPGWVQDTQLFIYTFHMPLFVFISGYLLIYTQQSVLKRTTEFFRKRFLKLIIPYFALSLIAILPKYLFQSYLNDSLSLDAESIIRVFLVPRENIWGHFWFIPMIFILGILGFGLDRFFRIKKWNHLGWGITTSVSFLTYLILYKEDITGWLSINDIIYFGWYFSLGALCATFNLLNKIEIKGEFSYSFTSIVLSLTLFMIGSHWQIGAFRSALIAVLMIFGLCELCSVIVRRINLSRNAIYTQTFTIFLLSWPCQAVANVLTERILYAPWYVIMTTQFLSGVFGPLIIIYLISIIEKKFRFHWISFILGKQYGK